MTFYAPVAVQSTAKANPVSKHLQRIFACSVVHESYEIEAGLEMLALVGPNDEVDLMPRKARGGIGSQSQRNPHVVERRNKVAKLHAEGKTVAEMHEVLGDSKQQIRSDHHFLDIEINAHFCGWRVAAENRREELTELMRRTDMTQAALARYFGVSKRAIFRDITAIKNKQGKAQ